MGLFTAKPPRSTAQVLVREVHVALWQVAGYVGVFLVLGLGVLEFMSSPHLERAANKLLSMPATADWIKAAQAPDLRGAK